jgi:hypothetical protein
MGKRFFPLHPGSPPEAVGLLVPWAMLAPHEAQAQHNHQQSLETLARRSGCDPKEILAIYSGQDFNAFRDMNDAVAVSHLALAIADWYQAEIDRLKISGNRTERKKP